MKNKKSVDEVKTMLINKGIRPSSQRVAILHHLSSVRSHPTADNVYNTLSPNMASLSRATVYNTLNLLAANDLILALTIEGDEQRFDADISLHGHFKCTKCNELYDIMLSSEKQSVLFEEMVDFEIDKAQIYMHGTCKKCLHKKRKKHNTIKS